MVTGILVTSKLLATGTVSQLSGDLLHDLCEILCCAHLYVVITLQSLTF